jgi:hypothetical protein
MVQVVFLLQPLKFYMLFLVTYMLIQKEFDPI